MPAGTSGRTHWFSFSDINSLHCFVRNHWGSGSDVARALCILRILDPGSNHFHPHRRLTKHTTEAAGNVKGRAAVSGGVDMACAGLVVGAALDMSTVSAPVGCPQAPHVTPAKTNAPIKQSFASKRGLELLLTSVEPMAVDPTALELIESLIRAVSKRSCQTIKELTLPQTGLSTYLGLPGIQMFSHGDKK